MNLIKDKAHTAADFLFGAALARYGFMSLLFSWHLVTLTESECLSSSFHLCCMQKAHPQTFILQPLLHFTGARPAQSPTARGLAIVILE